ncbi:hypothetical protein ONE63_000186 [Megalurothrips usitatus]|uniref:Kinetochore protein Spc24 n=1 Tax=Megalurothrips usitatus TaxID=439358 RepID=A0AAV7Y4T6_9NEOP|nr:hypothetical protein ONE63_000186 [Megalurothrips usitatus]
MDCSNLVTMVTSMSFEAACESKDYGAEEVLELVTELSREQKNVHDLTKKLQAESKAAKEKLSHWEKERISSRRELNKLKDDDATISKKLEKLKAEVRDVRFKINRTETVSSITEKDREILKKHLLELDTYKDATGIRWNFKVPDDVIEGLITNSKKNFVKVFNLEKSMPSKKIKDALWGLVKEAGNEVWAKTEENKENQENLCNKQV